MWIWRGQLVCVMAVSLVAKWWIRSICRPWLETQFFLVRVRGVKRDSCPAHALQEPKICLLKEVYRYSRYNGGSKNTIKFKVFENQWNAEIWNGITTLRENGRLPARKREDCLDLLAEHIFRIRSCNKEQDFSLLYSAQNDTGVHPTSYPVGTERCIPGSNAAEL